MKQAIFNAKSLAQNSRHLLLLAGALTLSLPARADHAGVNFSGDAALAASQAMSSIDSAGFLAQKFWNNASGTSGQVGIEVDVGSTIAAYYSGFYANWSGAGVGSASISGALPNWRLMKGSLLGNANQPAVVQVTGIPLFLTSARYALVVYCDAPNNTSNVVLKATLQAGTDVRMLYLRDGANQSFSGTFLRAPLNSTTDQGQQTATGNMFIFTNLSAQAVAIALEPAESNPGATVAVNAVQLVPSSLVQVLAPRITSALRASANVNEAFSYPIQTNVAASVFEATGLPAGLTLNSSTGVISGTPTQTGEYMVSITARNSAGAITETLQLNVVRTTQADVSLYMVPALLIKGEVGQRFLIEHVNAFANPNNWQVCTTLQLTNQAQFYVDLTATNAVKRFYRVTLQP